MKSNLFKITSEVWLYPSMAGWHFVSVPKKQAGKIKEKFGSRARGWGSLPVIATVGKTRWHTSIFPDKKSGTYLLPLKAAVRKKEHVQHGDRISLRLEVRVSS